jgi:hypothetical protein
MTLIAALAFATLALPQVVAAQLTQTENDSVSGRDVTDALMVNLQENDLDSITAGIAGMLAGETFTGRSDELIQQDAWLTTIGVQGIAYSFRIAGVEVTPENGYLAAAVRLADVQINVENIYLDSSNSWGCRNLPISSAGHEVPATSNVSVWAADRTLQISASTSHVGLDGDNFQVGSPAECDGALGVGWLLRQVLPWVVGLARDRIAEGAAAAAEGLARKTGESLNNYLNFAVTLPVSVPPAQGFNATVALWPERIEITPSRFRLLGGAHVELDPDPRLADEKSLPKALAKLPEALPSWIGLGRPLFAAIAAEASSKGLLDLQVDAEKIPWAERHLTVATLATILPDAADRFPADAPVSITIDGAAGSNVGLVPCGPGGIPIIESVLSDVTMTISVADEVYYRVGGDLVVALGAGYRQDERELALAFDSLTFKVKSHGFAPGVSPADDDFNEAALTAAVADWNADLLARYATLVGVALPNVPIGGKSLTFVGSRVEDDFLTIDALVEDVE